MNCNPNGKSRLKHIRAMRLITPAIFFLLLWSGAMPIFGATDIPALVEKLKQTADPALGITSPEQAIATQFLDIGSPAIPYLLPLLKDKNIAVRNLVGYILRDIKGLKVEDLDALIESVRGGNGWDPPAIARIGTPKAVDFLVDELVRERQTETQVTYAISLLGSKAAPRLADVYSRDVAWDKSLEETLNSVFHDLGDKAAGAVHPLLKIAADSKVETDRRVYAIVALGAIGLPAEPAVPTLMKLNESGPQKIRDVCAGAIMAIGSPDAVPFLIQKLKSETDASAITYDLRDIAELHERGRAAGPALLPYLDGPAWDVRAAAVRALGYIGYKPAADALIKMLDCQEDWRVALGSAESLGRLHAQKALPALARISQSYWYPPVREIAAVAIESIRDGAPFKSGFEFQNPPLEFFDYEEDVESISPGKVDSIRLPLVPAADEVVEVPVKVKSVQLLAIEKMRGVKVGSGYLVGGAGHANALPDPRERDQSMERVYAATPVRDEWFGFLDFVDSAGVSHRIEDVLTEAIYRMGNEFVAIAGHGDDFGSLNSAAIYRIRENWNGQYWNGQWVAEKWRQLPWVPEFSRQLKDGSVLVSCGGGIVLVSPDGTMKSLTRAVSNLNDR